jgi:hypothetical protein
MNTNSTNTTFNLQDYLDMLSKMPVPYDPTNCMRWKIIHYGTIPVDCIAVICMVVLYVWCADTRYSNTTYLFKMLAIDDLLAALFYIIWQNANAPGYMRLFYSTWVKWRL